MSVSEFHYPSLEYSTRNRSPNLTVQNAGINYILVNETSNFDSCLFFRMVLIINEHLVKEVPPSTSTLYTTWPRLKEASSGLTSLPTETMSCRGLLYLRPREYAVTVPQDEVVQILGTDDATTSVMAVLRHTGEYNLFFFIVFNMTIFVCTLYTCIL